METRHTIPKSTRATQPVQQIPLMISVQFVRFEGKASDLLLGVLFPRDAHGEALGQDVHRREVAQLQVDVVVQRVAQDPVVPLGEDELAVLRDVYDGGGQKGHVLQVAFGPREGHEPGIIQLCVLASQPVVTYVIQYVSLVVMSVKNYHLKTFSSITGFQFAILTYQNALVKTLVKKKSLLSCFCSLHFLHT